MGLSDRLPLWRRNPWLLRAVVLVVAAIAAALPAWWAPSWVAGIEDRVGDAYWAASAHAQAERRVVLVDIDERSLRDLGPWPWPRDRVAALLRGIQAGGAALTVVDVVFPESRPGDDVLRAALADTQPVMAQLFSLDPSVTPAAGTLARGLSTAGCAEPAPKAFGYYGLAPELAAAAASSVGHISPLVDADGVIRRLPALVCWQGRSYPLLAIAAYWRAAVPATAGAGQPAPNWALAASGTAGAWSAPLRLNTPDLPGWALPLDRQGALRVPYRIAREAFVSVPAADVLSGRADASDLLRGSIVMLGSTAFGMGDTVATPLSAVASGLEVHAQTLVGLLDDRIPYTPRAGTAFQAAVVLGLAALLLALAARGRTAPAKRLPLAGLVLALLVPVAALTALHHWDWWLPWFTVALFAIVASTALATVEHALVRVQRERLMAHLGSYLPVAVAERLVATEPTGRLQFEPREVSVMVASVRNFAALSTQGPVDETAALLHAYCCLAVEIVERHGGVVETVLGDAITAVWGSQAQDAEHPAQAVAAARELLQATHAMLASRRPVSEFSPLQPLALGLGLESGTALLGSYGPARRRAHAALGQPVSVAATIQQMTADVSVPILIGPELARRLTPERLEPMGDYLVEGIGRHLRLFTVKGWADLVPVDAQWAASASATDRAADSSGLPEGAYWRVLPGPSRPMPPAASTSSAPGHHRA